MFKSQQQRRNMKRKVLGDRSAFKEINSQQHVAFWLTGCESMYLSCTAWYECIVDSLTHRATSYYSSGSQTSILVRQWGFKTILCNASSVFSHGTPNLPLLILHMRSPLTSLSTWLISSSSICIDLIEFSIIVFGLSFLLPYFALVNKQPIQCCSLPSRGARSCAVPVGTVFFWL